MARGRRLRRGYDAVPATGEDGNQVSTTNETFVDEGEEDEDESADVEEGNPASRRGRQRQYQTVSSTDADSNEDNAGAEEDTLAEEDGTKITVVVMDPAQKKFHVTAYTHWTIAKFKEMGEKVHKVHPRSQRLIYRGQMLQDNKTLEQANITADKLIVHLFPKPRVVIQQDTSPSCSPADGDENRGAHVPQIILNPHEAEQRAHILVLGSADFLEAQNNVKLFSFLLFVISSVELFNLILILMGVPPNDASTSVYSSEDDFFLPLNESRYENPYDPYGNNGLREDPYQEAAIQKELQTWHPRNNIDMAISALGVYVALLGLRAANETTLRLAQQYLMGTMVVGVCWMLFNYWLTVHVDEEFDQLRRDERHNRTANATGSPPHYDDDAIPYRTNWQYYQENMSLMMIPGMVWFLCCLRAFQFQSLLEEAEREAEERIRNELAQHNAHIESTPSGDGDDGATEEDGGSDIELQTTRSTQLT